MRLKSLALFTSLAMAAGGAVAQSSSPGTSPQAKPGVIAVEPVYTESMKKLQQAAQRLRESIQAMAQKEPGPDRDRAINEAQEALFETQRAMIALPPELRSQGTVVSTADYDKSVKELMKGADRLRESIQAMAQQPAGERRNRAIQEAKEALWDTQQAMVAAYDPTRTAQSRSTPGASTGGSAGSTSGASGSATSPGQSGRQ